MFHSVLANSSVGLTFFLQNSEFSANTTYGYVVTFYSLALNTDTDNEMMAWFNPSDELHVHIAASTTYEFQACDNTELNNIMTNWNKHCFTWTSGAKFTVSCIQSLFWTDKSYVLMFMKKVWTAPRLCLF